MAGAVGARWLRRVGLRFDWPLLALPVVAGLALVDHDAAVLVGWTMVIAVLSGIRWHWRDLEVGGDVALSARQRIGVPAAGRRRGARWLVSRGHVLGRDGLLIGVDHR